MCKLNVLIFLSIFIYELYNLIGIMLAFDNIT
jgi:hypothetical protein